MQVVGGEEDSRDSGLESIADYVTEARAKNGIYDADSDVTQVYQLGLVIVIFQSLFCSMVLLTWVVWLFLVLLMMRLPSSGLMVVLPLALQQNLSSEMKYICSRPS